MLSWMTQCGLQARHSPVCQPMYISPLSWTICFLKYSCSKVKRIMSFQRKTTGKWQQEMLGARWLKADLHINTIDDYAGGRAKVPECLLNGRPLFKGLTDYARLFLQALVSKGIQVAGLTPHSPRCGIEPESSAVWHIVKE